MGEFKSEVGFSQSIGTSHFKGNIFQSYNMIFTKEWVVLSFYVTGKSKLLINQMEGLEIVSFHNL